MATHGDYSPQARERAGRTVDAAGVFADNAALIVAALPDVPEGHVLIAVVDDAHAFSGTHHVAQTEIVERVPQLEGDGGWAMVFTNGIGVEDVRRRTDEMAAIAGRRVEMIDRILTRRRDGDLPV